MSRIRTYFQRNRKTNDDIIFQCRHNPKNLKDRIIKDYRYIETMISLVLSDYLGALLKGSLYILVIIRCGLDIVKSLKED